MIPVGWLENLYWWCCGGTSHTRVCQVQRGESGLQLCCWGSPGPVRYWEEQKCRRMTMGSDGWILQASVTSFCAHQRSMNQQSGWVWAWTQCVVVLLTSRKLMFTCKSTSTPSIEPYPLLQNKQEGGMVQGFFPLMPEHDGQTWQRPWSLGTKTWPPVCLRPAGDGDAGQQHPAETNTNTLALWSKQLGATGGCGISASSAIKCGS